MDYKPLPALEYYDKVEGVWKLLGPAASAGLGYGYDWVKYAAGALLGGLSAFAPSGDLVDQSPWPHYKYPEHVGPKNLMTPAVPDTLFGRWKHDWFNRKAIVSLDQIVPVYRASRVFAPRPGEIQEDIDERNKVREICEDFQFDMAQEMAEPETSGNVIPAVSNTTLPFINPGDPSSTTNDLPKAIPVSTTRTATDEDREKKRKRKRKSKPPSQVVYDSVPFSYTRPLFVSHWRGRTSKYRRSGWFKRGRNWRPTIA